jgi:hypothetical protein
MDVTVVAIYVVCDEVLKMLEIKDKSQALMSTSEVAAFTIMSSRLFSGNLLSVVGVANRVLGLHGL